jgi:hypothetical protein
MFAFLLSEYELPHANTLQETAVLSAATQQFALDQESSLHSTHQPMLAVQLPISQSQKKLADISYGLATKRGDVLRRIQRRALLLRYE